MLSGCTFTYRTPGSEQLTATVLKSQELPAIPSGSAIEIVRDTLHIVSDDARYIYRCGQSDGALIDSIRLQHLPGGERRIPKPLKPDYEAAVAAKVEGQDCLVAFGSGSLQPQRDSALILTLNGSESQRVVSLAALYTAVRKTAEIALADFNIEAAAVYENNLVLINRGSNHLFSMDWNNLLAHLLDGGAVPTLKVSKLSLAKKEGYPIGISGACFLQAKQLIFCASVEATNDWVSDGAVLGSYFGVVSFDDENNARLKGLTQLVTESGEPIKDKVEGICSLGEKAGTLSVLGIVDNDDGSSRLLHIGVKNMPSP